MHTGAYDDADKMLEHEDDDCNFCETSEKLDEYTEQVGKLLKIHEVFSEGNL